MPSSSLLEAALRFVKSFFKQPVPARLRTATNRRIENLEERQLLAADLGGDIIDPVPFAEVSVETAPVTVKEIQLRVNGQDVFLDESDSKISLNAGDYVEVISLGLSVGQGLQTNDGVFAVEGYVNKLFSANDRSQTDYADGRFSARSGNTAVALGDVVQGGLDGGWTVEEGWDRLTLNLVHYFGNQSSREAAVSLLLEVGTPDFAFSDDVYESFSKPLTVGEEISITGSWLNQGDGRYHNYAEVDIFYEGQEIPEWVGVLVGNANSQNGVSGEFLFPTENGDMFTERWTPQKAGNYRIEFTVDPEKIWDESNEDNNRIRLDVTVAEPVSTIDVGNLGRGIVSHDRAEGVGFIMYTEEAVDERFKHKKVHNGNADHFVTVRFHDGQWQYDTNNKYVDFDIRDTDILMAKVELTHDEVEMLEGINYSFHGIQMGYQSSDVVVIQDRWNHRFNDGDFGVTGTFIQRHTQSAEKISFAEQSIEVKESTPTGSVLDQLDGVDQGFQFEFVSGNENGNFSVDPSGQLTLDSALDFETQPTHTLQIKATAGDDTRIFHVDVTVMDSIEDQTVGLGDLGKGAAANDRATGQGFILFSVEDVHDRFAKAKILADNADHLISVKLIDGQWFVDNNYRYTAFTPTETDVLVAKVNYDQNSAEVLAGINEQYAGIQLGVAETDLSIRPEQWGKGFNRGEFGLQGTTLVFHG